MTQPAITVEKLSKAYRIGLKEDLPDTLVGALQGVLRAPWKNWRRLRRLNTFRDNSDADDMIWALKDVSFEVQQGKVLGIIGRNGAGKSTLLKILSRITEPTFGRAVIRGRISSLLEVGTGFHQELTGRENIYLNGTILGMSKREIDRKFDEIVDFSGVEKFLDTPIKRYSSGMSVRLAFAVAAHLDPEILIIDEVLAVGDIEFQKKCLGKMQEVAGGGRTVLFVSHNMTSVRRLCDNAIVLIAGRMDRAHGVEEAIRTYCAGNTSCLERVWANGTPAPGDEFVQLRSISIRNLARESRDGLRIEDTVEIETCFEVLRSGACPTPNLHFFSLDGNHIFVSHDTDHRWMSIQKEPGMYRSVCTAPPHLFNTGEMTIGVALSTYRPFVVHCFEREALRIGFAEGDGALLYRAGYTGAVPGVVRPYLSWHTDFVGASAKS
jgi:lipopolysaccharide transport system ATP-binding protein